LSKIIARIWFAEVLNAKNVPGLDVPGIDFLSIAKGYGLSAYNARTDGQFKDALEAALATGKPALIEVETGFRVTAA
jgi:benzoylformate decarboxylase